METAQLLEKLFKWKKPVTYDDITLYMRIVPDSVIEDARKFALLESRRTRRDLRDSDSDAYLIYLDTITDMENEDLVVALVNNASRDVAREYIQTTPRYELPELGDFPSQEAQEEYEATKIEREADYIKGMEEHIAAWQSGFRTTLEKRNRKQLEDMFKRVRVDRVCEDIFNRVFEDKVISQALYLDKDYKKLAVSYEQYMGFPTEAKTAYKEAYNTLSVGTDEIKN